MNAGQPTKIRVLIVDDSVVFRTLISKTLVSTAHVDIIGAVADPDAAMKVLMSDAPDVMTLNLDSTRYDVLAFLERVMREVVLPVVVFSDLRESSSESVQTALSLGAVDVISKEEINRGLGSQFVAAELVNRIRAATESRLDGRLLRERSSVAMPNEDTSRTHDPRKKIETRVNFVKGVYEDPSCILAIAASTGGPEAIRTLLMQLPADIPPTLVVQHMPAQFTKSFADSLNSICPFEVREARHRDVLQRGVALVAPGNFHMTLLRLGGRVCVGLNQSEPLHGVRPAADPLFESIAPIMGRHAIGVVLTGMGRDGAAGLLKMRQAGAYNIAQDENSSVVFGMPREAFDRDAVQIVCPLNMIAAVIVAEVTRRSVAKVG